MKTFKRLLWCAVLLLIIAAVTWIWWVRDVLQHWQ